MARAHNLFTIIIVNKNKSKLPIFIILFHEYTVADVISCQIDSAERDECLKAAISHILPKLHVSFTFVLISKLLALDPNGHLEIGVAKFVFNDNDRFFFFYFV